MSNPSYVKPDLHDFQSADGPPSDNANDVIWINEYPTIDPAAFYGITGRITRAIAPHTEADAAAILIQFLIAGGCAIGHGPFFMVGATAHYTNLFTSLLEPTALKPSPSSWR